MINLQQFDVFPLFCGDVRSYNGRFLCFLCIIKITNHMDCHIHNQSIQYNFYLQCFGGLSLNKRFFKIWFP